MPDTARASTRPHLARRMADIQPFHVMNLLSRARELEAAGETIIHMEIGEPDFPTPQPIIEAGKQALDAGLTHYTPACGLPALRKAIAEDYRERFAADVDPARVVVTPGSSGALQLILSVLLDPGDRLLLTDPGYPCNRHVARLLEAEVGFLPLQAENGFRLQPAQVRTAWTPKTRALLLASPANPTGARLDRKQLRSLYQTVCELGGVLIVDEIYQGLVYDAEDFSALSLPAADRLFVVNSFSKYFGMTGWRLGWLVAPPYYVDALDRLAQNLFIAAPTLSQHAALAAFAPTTRAVLAQRRSEFQARRDYLAPALRDLGLGLALIPGGAFYLYVDSTALGADSFVLSQRLLEEAGVAVTPGRDFGFHRADQHLRFAYTTSLPRLKEGIDRIRRWLASSPV